MNSGDATYRLGIARRLDCAPWRAALQNAPGVRVISGLDNTLREFLRLGKLDAILVGPEALAEAPAGARILSGGCVACPAESLTDRVLSRVNPQDVQTLSACGEQTATPSLVAQCLWQDIHGHAPAIKAGGNINAADEEVDGVLWTGTCGPTPAGYRYSADLGLLWFEQTGLPLTWRIWLARPGVDVEAIDAVLRTARQGFSGIIADVSSDVAQKYGWNAGIVRRVLAELRSYALGDEEFDAVDELLFRGQEAGLLNSGRQATLIRR
jgi:predicted solute-binding protein